MSVHADALPLVWRRAGLVASLFLGVILSWLMLTPIAAPPVSVPSADKVFHAVVFAALVFPLIATDTRRWVWAVPVCIAFGGAVELIQPFVGRTGEWLDFGADVTGVLAGAALAETLHVRVARWLSGRDVAMRDAQGDANGDDPIEAADRQEALERLRAEMRDDLRAVLREEMANLAQHEAAADLAARDRAQARAVRH